jgi:hypothetical protein
MPTCYTSEIEKGQSFKEFALRCARNFGALMHMREDPLDANIYPPVVPDYYTNTDFIEKCCADIDKAMNASDEEIIATIEKLRADHEADQEKSRVLRDQYRAMAAQVREWDAPVQYWNVKDFMLEQLKISEPVDCCFYPFEVQTDPKLFRCDLIEKATKKMRYYFEEREKHRIRCEESSRWIAGFLESIEDAPMTSRNPEAPLESHPAMG